MTIDFLCRAYLRNGSDETRTIITTTLDAMAAGGFKTSIDFAQALLDEKRVAVTPGEAFDSPGFIRMSYATSMENLKEGSRRLVEFVQARAGAPAAAAR